MKSSNKSVKSNNKQAVDKMKYEIANEFGVSLGPDAPSRANGLVGGEITKRLVKMARSQLGGSHSTSNK